MQKRLAVHLAFGAFGKLGSVHNVFLSFSHHPFHFAQSRHAFFLFTGGELLGHLHGGHHLLLHEGEGHEHRLQRIGNHALWSWFIRRNHEVHSNSLRWIANSAVELKGIVIAANYFGDHHVNHVVGVDEFAFAVDVADTPECRIGEFGGHQSTADTGSAMEEVISDDAAEERVGHAVREWLVANDAIADAVRCFEGCFEGDLIFGSGAVDGGCVDERHADASDSDFVEITERGGFLHEGELAVCGVTHLDGNSEKRKRRGIEADGIGRRAEHRRIEETRARQDESGAAVGLRGGHRERSAEQIRWIRMHGMTHGVGMETWLWRTASHLRLGGLGGGFTTGDGQGYGNQHREHRFTDHVSFRILLITRHRSDLLSKSVDRDPEYQIPRIV